jgi:hypothetical protein
MATGSMDDLADRYASRAVRSAFIYTREAHPAENYRHHTSMDDKRRNARAFLEHSKVRRQILLDDLEGAAHRAYGSLPNMTWIIGRGGMIHYKSAWTSEADVADALEDVLDFQANRAKKQWVAFYSERSAWSTRDMNLFKAGLERNGPQAPPTISACSRRTRRRARRRPRTSGRASRATSIKPRTSQASARRAALLGLLFAGPAFAPPLADLLPDSRPGFGRNDVAIAWLAVPTARYAHGVLGDAIEAAALAVRLPDGAELRFELPADSVFEDLQPRVTDLDADGRDEIMVVRSRRDAGASLLVLGVRRGRLQALAETPAIGLPNRWLNPLGAADVDGDGRPDVLLVITPHIGGTLVVYHYGERGLAEKWRLAGFSNHVIGSRELTLHAFHDVDGDGTLDVIVPSANRRELRILSFADGQSREFKPIGLPAPVTGNFILESGSLTVPLAGGGRYRLRP